MSAAAAAARRRRAAGQSRLFDPARRRLGARSAPAEQAPHGPATAEQAVHGLAAEPGLAGLTLERKLANVWEGLAVAGSATCPLCGAQMRREPARAQGRCGGCGSTLS